ncbi:hypothetical protein Terro_1951 [Terriglobus roseus DSM 18391]|uniref:Lipoprotein n=1 Tax=Terriglobus roseus (strain DSM 18391 / NRRL B-41598 / KBS 63) TaxID=926566 RepID=I3ZG69_TERRK|nr:hypothetical protein [Terriglobus roseus]AFL88237.1 hypothetical protein Terro_1951 [Terriglobus roseus DSM 18391]
MRLVASLMVCSTVAFASLSAAAQQPAMPSCPGTPEIVRVSTIKPGKMDKFLEAVAAQAKWYKQQGTTDEISVLRVMDTNTGAWSATEALTTHTEPAGQDAKRAHNAGYDAFVSLFRESSDVKAQYVGCRLN